MNTIINTVMTEEKVMILDLKRLISEQGLTGKQLSEMVDISQPAMSDIINEKSFPRPLLLIKIAEALNVDVRDLFKSTKPDGKTQEELLNEAVKLIEQAKEKGK